LARPGAYFFFFAAFFLGALQGLQGTVVTSFANHLPGEDFSFSNKIFTRAQGNGQGIKIFALPVPNKGCYFFFFLAAFFFMPLIHLLLVVCYKYHTRYCRFCQEGN
jgi:hypothetical protein